MTYEQSLQRLYDADRRCRLKTEEIPDVPIELVYSVPYVEWWDAPINKAILSLRRN